MFKLEYLGELKVEFKMALASETGVQARSSSEKTRGKNLVRQSLEGSYWPPAIIKYTNGRGGY